MSVGGTGAIGRGLSFQQYVHNRPGSGEETAAAGTYSCVPSALTLTTKCVS